MRTTVRLSNEILTTAKQEAASRHISLTKLIEEALQEKLYIRNRHPIKRKVNLITVDGNGLKPGVDIDDSEALLEVLEE
jgi:hypothetical protein